MKSLFLFFFLLTTISVFPQDEDPEEPHNEPDYIVSESFMAWDFQQMQDNKEYYNQKHFQRVNKTLEITAHILIIGEDTTHSVADIQRQLLQVNEDFEETGISFSICDVRYFYGHQYDTISFYPPTSNYHDIIQKYYERHTINMYFVEAIAPAPGVLAGGVAIMPTGEELIKNDDWVFISSLWAISHELGHLFGLHHTHERDLFGSELADGSNCDTAGDLLCDTPADPDLSQRVNKEELYIGNEFNSPPLDASGNRFYPTTVNIMSYSESGRYFSPMQIKKMILVYNTYKTHLR